MKNSIEKLGIRSLHRKALSDRDKALLSLGLLLEKPVGIGDHSTKDYHDNLEEALNDLVDADDRLEILYKYFDCAKTPVGE